MVPVGAARTSQSQDRNTRAVVRSSGSFDFSDVTFRDLQERFASGSLTSLALTQAYLRRIEEIDRGGPSLCSIIETNPEAEELANDLDRERERSGPRSPLHGIPIVVKDNLESADRMTTTAGSLALEGVVASRDATVVRRLRRAGAVILAKANMSEWAYFRSTHGSSGWSARGGQGRNPYALDRSPLGSSSGSAAAVAANLCAAAIGTETDGSLVTPAAANCIVSIKPTVGLTSRAGVIPISSSQDTVGPMCRTVADAAALLTAIAGPDPADASTSAAPTIDYSRYLDPTALRGARIGVPRRTFFGYSDKADAIIDQAIEVMAREGAVIVDPANIPNSELLTFLGPELTVLLYEFKAGINRYLGSLGPLAHAHSLKELIAFNEAHAEQEMPYFGQELFHMADQVGSLTDATYLNALEQNRARSRTNGLDAVFASQRLDALVMPTTSPPWKIDLITGDHIQGLGSSPAAQAGYPLVAVPAGFSHGLPVGLILGGPAFSEPKLIALAYAFEQAQRVRVEPQFLSSVGS